MIFSNESRRQQLFSDVSDADWNDWRWQVANRAETLEDLKKYITLTAEEEAGVRACLGTLRMAITPYYLSLIDPNDPHDPIRRQAIPTAKELCRCSADLLDPLHEEADAGVPLGNQSVLLAGVNDCVHTMKKLVQMLAQIRVRPYYERRQGADVLYPAGKGRRQGGRRRGAAGARSWTRALPFTWSTAPPPTASTIMRSRSSPWPTRP